MQIDADIILIVWPGRTVRTAGFGSLAEPSVTSAAFMAAAVSALVIFVQKSVPLGTTENITRVAPAGTVSLSGVLADRM